METGGEFSVSLYQDGKRITSGLEERKGKAEAVGPREASDERRSR